MTASRLHIGTSPEQTQGTLFSPPNLISLCRVLPIPLIYWSFERAFDMLAIGLLTFSLLTDAADGYLARRFGWQSRWGVIFDPVADKILIGSLSVFLVLYRDFPVWMAGLILFRDAAIVAAGVFLFLKRARMVVPSNRMGKLTTVATAATMILYTLNWQPYGVWVLYGSLVCIMGSGIYYMIGFLRLTKRDFKPTETASSMSAHSVDHALRRGSQQA